MNKSIYKLCKVRERRRESERKKEKERGRIEEKESKWEKLVPLSLSSPSFFNFFLSFLRSMSKGLQRSIAHTLDILEHMG